MAHNFNEKTEEYSAKDGKYIPVWLSPKYLETKNKVIGMLDSGIYKGLDDSYFWILMNRTKSGKMAYTGLIISHDGMKVINDNLPNEIKVKPAAFSPPITSEVKKECMYMYYQDDDTYEFGEVSPDNCQNAYPYAMLYKRTFDRVVKSKAKMYGVYSEEEADEFRKRDVEVVEPTVFDDIRSICSKETLNNIYSKYNISSLEELGKDKALDLFEFIKSKQGAKKDETNK